MILATCDSETDPFKYGRIPKPFTWGFYTKDGYKDFWPAYPSEDMGKVFVEFLSSLEEPHLIYAHNGGRFDFYFLLHYAAGNSIRIVNGRILEMRIGIHTLRDSYAILPIPLREYNKDEFDYTKLEKEVREKHKEEILHYQKNDCKYLYELVEAFIGEFGNVLTIGTASMQQFAKFHKVQRGSSSSDERMRKFYFGGRCQCFETGIITGPLKIYDVNSMYPAVMRNAKHPITVNGYVEKAVGPTTCFVIWEGDNYGAVPTRTKLGLDFNVAQGKFYSTIHEFEAGLDTGTIKPNKIIAAYNFEEAMTFDAFVNWFYEARLKARENKDLFHTIFYKLILNSAYGKQAQDPSDFKDFYIQSLEEMMEDPWTVHAMAQNYALWSKPALSNSYYNVATASSITGAARAKLLRGISNAVRPIYCDTDSIICEDLREAIHDKELGAWKLEAEGSCVAVAGKKLYAFQGVQEYGPPAPLKQASKGSRLTFSEIMQVAGGSIVTYQNPVPAFKLDGKHQFIERNIRDTSTHREIQLEEHALL